MGKGRPRTPTAILKARGSWRANERSGEPAAPADVPAAPDWLDADGVAEWKRITPILAGMGILSTADRGALAGMCQAWSLFVKTSRVLNSLTMPHELLKARSLFKACDGAQARYMQAASAFGLTPSARSKVQSIKEEKPQGKLRFFKVG